MSENKKKAIDEVDERGVLDGKSVSRRDFLKIAGIAGATIGVGAGLGGLVAACGGTTITTGAPTTTAATTATTAAQGSTTTVAAGPTVGKELKVGFVTPLTGAMAAFGIPDKYSVDRVKAAIGDGIIGADGQKHPVTIITTDSQSDSNRAAQVAGDLISNNKVDLLTAASTADVVCPVADQAEANSVPCISTDCPWQNYVATRAKGDLTATFQWTYNAFWGVEDVVATYVDMWNQVPNNKKVGVILGNNAPGNAWLPVWKEAMPLIGLTGTFPSQYQPGTEDFTSYISQFKKDGCEVGLGMFSPPDFATFWKQSAQQGWKPKTAAFAIGLLFPQAVEAVGDLSINLCTEVQWTPSFGFTSALLNEDTQTFADKFTAATNGQWTQPLAHFIVLEWAVDVLKRAATLDNKGILDAITTTKLDTIVGPIDFTAPIVGGNKIGPMHNHKNNYKTPMVGGQWRKGTKWPYDLTIVSNVAAPSIKTQDKVLPLNA